MSYRVCLSQSDVSLSTVPSRPIHVAANGITSLFFMAEYDSIVCICVCVCVCVCVSVCVCISAAAAKSLQSCPTLCDPIDCSPPGSPVPGILQARTLEWVAISSSNA